jgi:hypothetical protein
MMMSATMLLTTLRNMQNAAVDMIETNEKNEKEETALRVFRDNKARGVPPGPGAVVSTRQRQETKCTCSIVSTGKQKALNNHMSPRTSMAGRRAVSSVALGTRNKRRRAIPRHSSLRGSLEEIPEERSDEKDENDVGIFQNINDADGVSDTTLSSHQRQETKCNIVCKGKHAAPKSHMSPRRAPRKTIAGRRGSWSASSNTLGTESKGRHVFKRQSSLRGWHESDSKHDDSLEISKAKWTRLHDYDDATLSPQKRPVRRRILSPVKQAAPSNHAIPIRSIASRRGSWTASSTTFGPGSKDRHAFPRQSSLRGCDSGYDAALVDSSKVRRTRLHDYTESPINVL